jgi:hypothetical protein
VRLLAAALVAVATLGALTGCGPTRPEGRLTACDPNEMIAKVDLREADTGAGVVAVNLEIINRSGDWCTLDGYPTVHILSAVSNAPVGQGAVPMADRPGEIVDLPPNETAYALIETTKAMTEFTGCEAQTAQGMSVVLPGSQADKALVLPSPVAQFCNLPELETLLVSGFSLEPFEGHDGREADG